MQIGGFHIHRSQIRETPGRRQVEKQRSIKMKLVARFVKNESGATAIEYGLIAALISVAIIGGATALGGNLNTLFGNLAADVAV